MRNYNTYKINTSGGWATHQAQILGNVFNEQMHPFIITNIVCGVLIFQWRGDNLSHVFRFASTIISSPDWIL